jgi:hypothetical protein
VRLEPGQTAQAGDGRALIVVRTVDDGPGAQELLAVGNYAAAGSDDAGAEKPAADGAAMARVSGPLTLPYTLPA